MKNTLYRYRGVDTNKGSVTIIRKDGKYLRMEDTPESIFFLQLLTDEFFLAYREACDRQKIYFAESGCWWAGALEVMEEIETPAIDLPGERFLAYIRLARWKNPHLSPERQNTLNEVKKLIEPIKTYENETQEAEQ